MKISTALDLIDAGQLALPEFQRGYVWNREQVRGLMAALYRRHPVGGLLIWVTDSDTKRRGSEATSGTVNLLLDGQQRITSLYGIVRGRPPKFFQGDALAFKDLYFNLESEEFAFYSPVKMREDPLWIDVTRLMKENIAPFVPQLSADPRLPEFLMRLTRIHSILGLELHAEQVTGTDKTIDVVVDIFNRVNSGGTKLSTGDLALAKVCAEWPEAREAMRQQLDRWKKHDLHFELDWLLRCVNAVVAGEARFIHLHRVDRVEFEDGLNRTVKACDYLLNAVGDRLGLDHDRVLFGRYAFPVMARLLDQRALVGKLDAKSRDRLLFWFLHAAMWGRFSGNTESTIDKDLEALERSGYDVEALLRELQLWKGDSRIQPDHFGGWSLGARLYPVLYLLTRVGESRDLGTGLTLKAGILGKGSKLEVHHIFPKSRLYKSRLGLGKSHVNAVANYCFLTQTSNLYISDRLPEEYLAEVAANHPDALESQWIPTDPQLWRLDRYLDFLEARKTLLADAANSFLDGLLHGEPLPHVPRPSSASAATEFPAVVAPARVEIPGGIDSEEEEQAFNQVREWLASHGLPEGVFLHEVLHPSTGEPLAILDLAWPDGIQVGLSAPVALLLDESAETHAAANAAGYRYFIDVTSFRRYVVEEVLAETSLESSTAQVGFH